jgi:hypothetical protein
MTRKGRNSNGGRLGRKEVTMLGPFEVDNIRRGGRARKVVHAFVKTCMGRNFDMIREGIKP